MFMVDLSIINDGLQGGAPKIAKLVYKLLNSMVYGRYNELVNGDYQWFINQLITGGPHPVPSGYD